MKTEQITIDATVVEIRPKNGDVWMTQNEIARLFSVFVSAIGANIRSILKRGILRETEVVRHTHHRDGSITTHYNLEMVATLAFHLDSPQAETFRRWLVRGAISPAIVWKIPRTDSTAN